MQQQSIGQNLTGLAFDFFYKFSRFEFALKENGFLKSHTVGDDAEADWDDFVKHHQENYVLSEQAQTLLANPPKRQIVGANGALSWRDVGRGHCRSELEEVVLFVKRIRNNLFHGGKHGGDQWDDPKRTGDLINIGSSILNQFAQIAGIQSDYLREY